MGDLQVMNATEAKTHFGTLMSRSQRSPVVIRKNNRDFSVMLSLEDFDDMLLGVRAMRAKNEGMLSVEATKNTLDKFR